MHNYWKMKRLVKAIIILAFIGISEAGPLTSRFDTPDYPVDDTRAQEPSDGRCSTICPQRSLPWTYATGTTYNYDYSVETTTFIKGTSGEKSTMKLEARVEITPITECDFELKVSDVKLNDILSPEMTLALQKHRTQFTFEDGKISDICTHPAEEPWILNMKKGVATAFQVSSEDWSKSLNITETDIVGTCITEYAVVSTPEDGSASFMKKKNMRTCKNNQKLFQFALNLPDFNVQQLSILESEHVCQISLAGGILSGSQCQEEHTFKPFSSGQSGAVTSQLQKLTLVSTKIQNGSPLIGPVKKDSLQYDHHQETQDVETNVNNVVQILTEYSSSEESGRPDLFTSLVHSLRHLPSAQLTHIFYKISNFATRKFMLDAIPLLRTDAAVTLMRDIISSKQLNEATLDNWFTSLAFYKNPTRAMITTAETFLDISPRQSALLAISSLVRTYCESKSDCHSLPEVQTIVLKYEKFLGTNCSGDNGISLDGEDEDKIVLSLKALRNIGFIMRSEGILEKCYQDPENSIQIRLAAMDTIRMLSCTTKHYEPTMMKMFTDSLQDSELRIGAYLVVMNCPTESTVETVKNVLVNEQVNQVGSFVWTHLTNLQESQSLSPNKIALKKLVGERFLKNKWNTDVRKFSRYFETSYYAKEIQVGATAEGNVIFSQESYLPRSAMVNLSVNVFGENLNLLEFGGRAEGFEPLVEGLFGQDGRFREDTFHKLLQGMRSKRDVSEFQSTFNSMREEKPRGSFYLKTFGKDIHYSSFHGLNELSERISFWPNSILGSTLTGNKIDFSRSSIFLDGSIVLPTVAGLPLKLSVNGTSTVGLKSSTDMNLSNLFTNGQFSAEAHIYPSATVQITGLMEVDARVAKTGLKSLSKFHTNTYLDGKVIVDGVKLAKVEINMPRDTMEIFEASADFYTWQSKGVASYKPLESDNAQEMYSGCSSAGKNLLGLEICAVAKYHYVPENDFAIYFTGPTLAKISLKKTDPFQKYVIDYSWNTRMKEENSQLLNEINLTYDTPGTQINRRSSLEIKFDEYWTYFALSLDVPLNKIDADLVYYWTPEKKMVKAGVMMDKKNVIFIYTLFKAMNNQGKYTAEAKVNFYDAEFLKWIGTVVLTEKRKSLDLKLDGTFHDPVKLSGDIYISADRYDLMSNLKSTAVSVDVSAQLRHTETSFSIKADTSYKIQRYGTHKITIDGNYEMGTQGKLLKHHAQISINPSQFPFLATEISWDTQLAADYLENSGKLRFGSRAYNFEQIFSSQATEALQELIFKLSVRDTVSDAQYKIDFLHRIGKMESNNRLALSFQHYHIEGFARHKITLSPSATIDIATGLVLPGGHNYAAGMEVSQQKFNDYKGNMSFRWGPDEDIDKKISAEFTMQKGNEAFLNYGFTVNLFLPHLQTLSSSGTLIIDPATGSIFHLSWTKNNQHYSAKIEYSEQDLEHKVDAVFSLNNDVYKASVRASDREAKSLFVEFLGQTHYELDIMSKDNFGNIQVNLFWDKANDATKSLFLKSEFTNKALEMKFRFMEHAGEIIAECVEDGIRVASNYDGQFLTGKVTHSHQALNYGLGLEIDSSFEAFKKVQMIAKAALLKSDESNYVLDSKLLFKWNSIHHSVELTGTKSSSLRVQLKTASTYQPLDDLSISFDHKKDGKEVTMLLNANYQSQNLTLEVWHSTLKAKEGKIRLFTPFDEVRVLSAEYTLILGRVHNLVLKLDHNEGANSVEITAEGFFRAGDVGFSAKARHSLGADIDVGLNYKFTNSEKILGAFIKFGESRGFNSSASLISNGERISQALFALKYLDPSKPLDFILDFNKSGEKFGTFNADTTLNYLEQNIFSATIRSNPDTKNGDKFLATVNLNEMRLDIKAKKTQDERNEESMYNLTTSIKGEPHSCYLFFKSSKMYSDDTGYFEECVYELKTQTPEKQAGLYHNFVIKNTLDFDQQLINITTDVYGFQERARMSLIRSFSEKGWNTELDLDTSFIELKKAKLEANFGRGLTDNGHFSIGTIKGIINRFNEDSDFNITIKEGVENTFDKFVTISYEGFEGPFLLSTILRQSPSEKSQFQFLMVLPPTERYSGFYEIDLDNKVSMYANFSSPGNDLLEVSGRYDGSNDGGVNISFSVKNPGEIFVVRVALQDADDEEVIVQGFFNAPIFSIDAKNLVARYDSNYSRFVAQITDSGKTVIDVKAGFDMGNAYNGDFGMHSFFKFDASIDFKNEISIWSKKVIFDAQMAKRGLRLFVHTPFENWGDLKLEAKINDVGNTCELVFLKDNDQISASFQFDPESRSKFGFEGNIKSTFHSFREFIFAAKLNLVNSPVVVEVLAKTESLDHELDIKAEIGPEKGTIKMSSVLPILSVNEKNLQVQYNLNGAGGDAVIYARGSVYDVHWERDAGQTNVIITTPVTGYESVAIQVKHSLEGNERSIFSSVKVNEQIQWLFVSSLHLESFRANIALKTPFDVLSSAEMKFVYHNKISNGGELSVSYKDQSVLLIMAELAENNLKYALKIGFLDTHSVQIQYDVNLEDDTKTAKVYLKLLSPFTKEHSISAYFNWTPTEGLTKILIKNMDHETSVEASFQLDEPYKGTATLSAKNLPLIDDFLSKTSFNVGTKSKQVKVWNTWGKHNKIDLDITYEMTEDTFDGTLVVSSTIPEWELTTFRGKYNISARPSASVSYEKDGVKKEILVEVVLDKRKPIPTIYITTPYSGYEHLILSGDFQARDHKYMADFTVTCNSQKIVVFTNKAVVRPDFSMLELTSTLLSPIEEWTSLQLEVAYKRTDPLAAKLKFLKEGNEYSMRARVSIAEKEFKISAITPFDGFESIGLSGKFGTTSIGKQFGVSFESNDVRRDVSVAYGIDEDNVTFLELRSPLRQVRSARIESNYMSDDPASKLVLGFETSGENNDFGFGIMYDFSQGIANGKGRLSLKADPLVPGFPKVDATVTLAETSQVYVGKIEINLGESSIVTINSQVSKNKASVLIETSVPDYKTINIQFESDYASQVSLLFELNNAPNSIVLKFDNQENVDINIKTQFVGYETIDVNHKILENGTRQILVDRSGRRISNLLITTQFDGTSGGIEISWRYSANVWARATGSFRGNQAKFLLETFSPTLKKLHFDVDYDAKEKETSVALAFGLNEKFFIYNSVSRREPGLYEGRSETKTNFEWTKIWVKGETTIDTYKVKYNLDLSEPFILQYKTVTDGLIEFEVDGQFTIDLTRGYDLKLEVEYPLVFLSRVATKSSLTFDVSGSQKTAKWDASFKYDELDKSISLEGRLTNKDFSFLIKSNIPTIEEVKGKIAWTDETNKTKVTFLFAAKGAKQVQGSLAFDKSPFSRLVFVVQQGEVKQEVEVRVSTLEAGNYKLSFSTKGWLESKLDINVVLKSDSVKLVIIFKASTTPLGPLDFAITNTVKFQNGNYEFDIRVQNNGENRERRVRLALNLESPLAAGIEAHAMNLPFEIPNFQLKLVYDFNSDLKTFTATCDVVQKRYSIDGRFNWSPESSIISVEATGAGGYLILFTGERTGLSSMKYDLDFLGTAFSFESTNDIRAPTDFDISAHLNIPIFEAAPQISLKVSHSQGTVAGQTHSLSGSLAIKNNEVFSIKFLRTDVGEFDLSAATPLPQVSKLEFKHLHTPSSDATNGILNEYNLRWNDDNSVKLNYKTVSKVTYVNLDAIINSDKVIGIVSKITKDHGKVYSIDAQLTQGTSYLNVLLETQVVSASVINFNAVFQSNLLPGKEASLKAIYTRKSKLEVTVKNGEKEASLVGVLSIDDEGTGGGIKLDFTNNFSEKFRNVHFDGSAHYTVAKKSATLILKYDTKTFSLEATATKEELELLVSTPVPGIEYLKFETEFETNKYTAELDYGKKGTPQALHVEVELNSKNSDLRFFNFEASRGSAGYTLSGKIDLQSMVFSSDATWPDGSIKLMTQVDGDKVNGELKTPFKSFENVNFEGKWTKSAKGATFSGFGNVNSLKHTFDAAYESKDQGFSVTWRAAKGASEEIVFEMVCLMDKGKNLEAKLSLTGTSFNPLVVEGGYEIAANKFHSELAFTTPYNKLPKGKAEVQVGFKHPFAYEFKAGVSAEETIFDIDVGFSVEEAENKFLRLGVAVPALGINANDLRIEFGYKVVSANDFEVIAETTIAGTPRKGVLKWRCAEDKIDGELTIAFVTKNVQFQFGGERTPLSNGGVKLSGYLNNCNLELTYENKNLNGKLLIDFGEKIFGIFESASTGIPRPITADIHYDHLKAARIAVKLGEIDPQTFFAAISVSDNRGLVGLEINHPALGHRSATVVVEYGPSGRLEVTLASGENIHRVELEGGSRRARAAVSSPALGQYEFEMESGASSGIVVLTTTKGLHKVSYDVKYTSYNTFEVDIHLESPWLNNGQANGKLTVNGNSHNYRGLFSLNNDHFLSGSFEVLTNGFEAAFSIQSSLLPTNVKTIVSYTNDDMAIKSDLSFEIFDSKHSGKFSLSKNFLRGRMGLSSPWLSCLVMDAEAELTKDHNNYQLVSTVMMGNRVMKITGDLSINGCFDHKLVISYVGNGFSMSDASIHYNFNMTGQSKKVNVVFLSDHKDFKDIRFGVSFEVLEGQSGIYTILASITTPFQGFEDVSSKLTYPKITGLANIPRDSFVSAEIQTSGLGTLKGSLDWKCMPNKFVLKVESFRNSEVFVHAELTTFYKADSTATRLDLRTTFDALKSAKFELDSRIKGSGISSDIQIRSQVNEKDIFAIFFGYQADCKYISGEIVWPDNKYSLDLGMKNCAGMMAHFGTPRGGLGAKVSYLLTPSIDIQAMADLTFLNDFSVDYKLLDINLAYSSKPGLDALAKIRVNERVIFGKLKSSTVESLSEVKFEGQINDYIKLDAAVQTSPEYKFTLKSDLPDLSQLDVFGHYKEASDDTYLKVDFNKKQRLFLVANPTTKNLSVKDLYYPVAVSIAAGLSDGLYANFNGEICWNTNDCESETERIEVVVPTNPKSLEKLSLIVFWRNRQTSSFFFEKTIGSSSIKYMENDATVFFLQSIAQNVYNSGEGNRYLLKYSVNLPDRFLAVEWKQGMWILKETELKLTFGKTSELPKVHGIAMSLQEDKQSDELSVVKLGVRKIGSDVDGIDQSVVLTIRKESISHGSDMTTTNLVKLKIGHPTIEAYRAEITGEISIRQEGTNKYKISSNLFKSIGFNDKFEMIFTTDLDLSRMSADGTLTANGNKILYKGRISNRESSYGLSGSLTKNGLDPVYITADVDSKAPSLRMQINNGGFSLFAGLESDKEAVASVTHMRGNLNVDDVRLYANLEHDDNLVLGANWRPELVEDLQRGLDSLSSNILRRFVDQMSSDGSTTYSAIYQLQSDFLDDLNELFADPLSVQMSIGQFVSNLRSMKIYENEYVQKAVFFVERGISTFSNICSCVLDKGIELAHGGSKLIKDLSNSIYTQTTITFHTFDIYVSEVAMAIDQLFTGSNIDLRDLASRWGSYLAKFRLGLKSFVEWYHGMLNNQSGKLAVFVKDLAKNIERDAATVIVEVTRFLKQYKVFNDALSFYFEYQSWLEEIHFSQHIEETVDKLQRYAHSNSGRLSNWKNNLVQIWDETCKFFTMKYHEITQYPIFGYLSNFSQRVYRVLCAVVHELQLDQQFRKMSVRTFGHIDSIVSVVVNAVEVLYGNKELMTYSLEHNPESGSIVYRQGLPFKWKSFKEFPDILKLARALGFDNLDSDNNESSQFSFVDFQYDLMDTIHTISTALATRSLVPPFSARAIISGDYHLMTFDNKFYDFSGSQGCSYLLTSDFLHNRFSVIANFGEDQKRTSLTILSDNKQIDFETKMNPDGETLKVTIDKRQVELPQMFRHTLIKREGSTIILENSEGLRVVCNTAHDVCSITVSGWYFGKTGGLLGVYDYEPSNDWTMPDRRVTDNLSEFVSSWQMDKSKRCPVKIEQANPQDVSSEDKRKCSSVFGGETSALMPCYSTIDVNPFLKICISNAAREGKQGVCSAAAAYIEHCKMAGVEIWMPAECIKCSTATDEQLKSGESKSYQENAPMSADIVFLVEQSSCLNQYKISELPTVFDKELNSKGFFDNRFALVGYGGQASLASPHIFTIGNRIFGDSQKTTSSFQNLKNIGNDGNVFAAMKFSARLPFRPGVSKSIILVTCNHNSDGSFYGDAMTMLTEQAIVLHHLTAGSTIQWKSSKSRPADKILGFSKTSVYTSRQITEEKGDTILRRQIKDPKDYLSTLAMENGGTVFSLQRFDSELPGGNKKVATSFAIQVAVRFVQTPCLVCDCVADLEGVGRLQCHKCIVPYMDIVLWNWEMRNKI